jgi:hypothetical protein
MSEWAPRFSTVWDLHPESYDNAMKLLEEVCEAEHGKLPTELSNRIFVFLTILKLLNLELYFPHSILILKTAMERK